MTPNIHDIPGIGGFYTKKEVDILISDAVAEAKRIYEESMRKHNRDAQILYSKDMILETFLILVALPFVGLTLFFGTKGGYYDSDDYNGDGCAHDVKR